MMTYSSWCFYRVIIVISWLFLNVIGMDEVLPNRKPYIPHIGKVTKFLLRCHFWFVAFFGSDLQTATEEPHLAHEGLSFSQLCGKFYIRKKSV